jgi:hypothetical protein
MWPFSTIARLNAANADLRNELRKAQNEIAWEQKELAKSNVRVEQLARVAVKQDGVITKLRLGKKAPAKTTKGAK